MDEGEDQKHAPFHFFCKYTRWELHGHVNVKTDVGYDRYVTQVRHCVLCDKLQFRRAHMTC